MQSLLDAVVDYMPSPLDVEAIKGTSVRTGHGGLGRVRKVCSGGRAFSRKVFTITRPSRYTHFENDDSY